MTLRNAERPGQLSQADGASDASETAEASGDTLILADSGASDKSTGDVNMKLRRVACPLCTGGARCVRGGSRLQIWRCDDEECGVEFGVGRQGRGE